MEPGKGTCVSAQSVIGWIMEPGKGTWVSAQSIICLALISWQILQRLLAVAGQVMLGLGFHYPNRSLIIVTRTLTTTLNQPNRSLRIVAMAGELLFY